MHSNPAIRSAILLLMFVGLPLISWYYLTTGLKWRKDNLAELGVVGKIRPAHYIDGAGIEHDLLEKRVCVTYLDEDGLVTDDTRNALLLMEKVYVQFNARPELRLVVSGPPMSLDLSAAVSTKQGANTDFWVQTGAVGAWKTIVHNAMDSYTIKRKLSHFTNYVCLSDINGNVRGVYQVGDEAQEKKLAQHLAILLPMK
jgi:hypothetical protein